MTNAFFAGGHRGEGADDLELAGGFAREIKRAIEMTGAELTECKLQQHAGLAETGRRLEKHERIFFEGGGQLGLRGFLAGTRSREGRPVAEAAQARAGALAQIEELGDAFELSAEERVVGGGERDGLREAAPDLDKNQFGARKAGLGNVTHWVTLFGRGNKAEERGVSGELNEILWIVGAQFSLVGGKRAGDGFDLAENHILG